MTSLQAELNSLTNLADIRRCNANGRLDPEHKSAQGQFMTQRAVAKFMASLYQTWQADEIRLLDAGAGVGSLTAAFVEEFLDRKPQIKSLAVTAYEPDPILARELQATLQDCRAQYSRTGAAFDAELLQTDFIEAGAYHLGAGLQLAMWGEPARRFTHAILNPPYKKIHSESSHRYLLRAIGIETSNLYTGFLAIAIRVLEPGGELVAITPRSFCNGPYFKPFRELLLQEMALLRIHVFESRTHAFQDDEVLQENIIFHAVKGQAHSRVMLSVSQDADFSQIDSRIVDYAQVIHPNDPDLFIHVVANEDEQQLANQMKLLPCTLAELGVEVSTGPVVDFRLKEYLYSDPQPGAVPLIYPAHCKDHAVTWPISGSRKPNAIADVEEVRKWLYPNGHYVVMRRFSAKEERRRVVAAVHDPGSVPGEWIGFENHLNVLHWKRRGLAPNLVRGLAVYLNSTFYDSCFRHFNGHTQVNAKDIRNLRYPSVTVLEEFGRRINGGVFPTQEEIDTWITEEVL